MEKAMECSTAVRNRLKKVTGDVLQGAKGPLSSAGLYYGVSPNSMERQYAGRSDERPTSARKTPRKARQRDAMTEALEELRLMRLEMEALRREFHEMQSKIPFGEGADDREVDDGQSTKDERATAKRRKRRHEFERISAEVERWAKEILKEGEDDGWVEVKCNKMFQTMNRDGQTRVYIKWMKDSRGKLANPGDDREYPCIKMYSTIDAPLDEVCLYLAQAQFAEEYNSLIDRFQDLEEISTHSKVCLGQTPQILFLKPRSFVTFCSHRWLRDGTQIVINQACDDATGEILDKQHLLAYAIRGANFIARHPNDPDKTQITMLSHGNPGHDVPVWAIKTAVNSLAPIESFRLFHKLNQGVLNNLEDLRKKSRQMDETELVSSGGISRRPAGLAQLGYACFWPNGGGIQEGRAPILRLNEEASSPDPSVDVEPHNIDQPIPLLGSEAPNSVDERLRGSYEVHGHQSQVAHGDPDQPTEESSLSSLAPVFTES
jgi:hypothetical protein